MPASRGLLDVVRLSTEHLAGHGSDSPRLDAELLCAHALGLRRLDLYLQHDRPLDDSELEAVRRLLRRRARGEPVAYITGVREFRGRSFGVAPAVLIPRPETETLVGAALEDVRDALQRQGAAAVADLGTGSGCVGISIAAEVAEARVWATDLSPEALEVARGNAARHGVSGRVELLQGCWAQPLPQPVDVLVSNPPYVTSSELAACSRDVRDFEPALALHAGDDGLGAYRALLATAAGRLRPQASLLLEVDPRRAGAVAQLLQETFPQGRTSLLQDLAGRDRVVRLALDA